LTSSSSHVYSISARTARKHRSSLLSLVCNWCGSWLETTVVLLA
jgi:hypothetical protein